MRVCLITDYLSPTYGWGRHALGVIRALRDLGVSIRLVSPQHHVRSGPDLAGLADHQRVPSFVQEARGLLRLTGRALPAIVAASRDCDVLHCLTEPYVVPAALAAGPATAASDCARHVCHSSADTPAGSLVAGDGPTGGQRGSSASVASPAPNCSHSSRQPRPRWCRRGSRRSGFGSRHRRRPSDHFCCR